MTATDRSPVTVYVPADAHRTAILAASGIVGTPTADNRQVLVDYEGDKMGPTEQFALWADRINHAWGRHADRYPTVARAVLASDDLVAVGVYDPVEGVVALEPGCEERVADWLSVPKSELSAQLQTGSVVRHQQRREIREALTAGTMPRAAIAAYARRYGHEDLLG